MTDKSESPVVIVSGLPRSGTSMMMRALQAGGMPLLTDGRRVADDDNPLGYFELDAVRRLAENASVLSGAAGHAVKVIHALLGHLPAGLNAKVLFMMRDVGEVVRSQRVMLERSGKGGAALPDDRLRELFEAQRSQALQSVSARAGVEVLEVDYARAVAEPGAVFAEIDAFLGGGLDVRAMADAVDPALYRQRG